MKRLLILASMILCLAMLTPGRASAASIAEAENNDTVGNATEITTNNTVVGNISQLHDRDWFSFELSNPGVIQFSFSHPVIASTDVYWKVYLYDELGMEYYDILSVIGKNDALGEEIGLPAGKYNVLVVANYYYANDTSSNDRWSDATYSLTVGYTKSSAWEKESNNSSEAATEISLNKNYNGSIMMLHGSDWYSFELPEDGVIQINFSHPVIASNDTYWKVYLYDELALDLYDSRAIIGKSDALFEEIGLPAGKYKIKVTANYYYANDTSSNDRWSDSTYTIMVGYKKSTVWEKEGNNSLDKATEISLNKDYYGSVMMLHGTDWYSFELPYDGVIQLDFKHPVIASADTYWKVYLYDELGLELHYSRAILGKSDTTGKLIGLPAGKYTIKVTANPYYSNDTSSNDRWSDSTYTIRVGFTKTALWEKEGNNTSATATYVPVNTDFQASIMQLHESDWFEFELPSDGVTQILFSHPVIASTSTYWKMYLYDELALEQYKSFTVSGNSDFSSGELGLSAGKYKLKITANPYYSNDTSSNDCWSDDAYTLRIKVSGLPVVLDFDANSNATGAPQRITKTVDTVVTIPSCSMSRTGYKLLGWALDKNATEADYVAGDQLILDSYKVLYAVWKPAFITTQPKSVSTPVGDTAKFSVVAVGSGLKYQWQAKAPNASSWSNSSQSGSRTATLSIATNVNHNGYKYRCVVTDSYGKKTYSNAVTLTIIPKITTQPSSKKVTVESTAVFTIAATGKATLTYQWQCKSPSATSWSNSTQTGAKTTKLSVTTNVNHNGYQYRCVVTDGNGKKAYSNAVTLTVNPKITTQPSNKTVAVGNKATFSVAVVAKATVKYQWQCKSPSATTWSNSTQAGATTATLTVTTNVNHNGYQYRCVVTDGNGKTVTSNAATLTIIPKITTQPSNKSVSAGTTVTFTVAATGKEKLTYQWQYKAPNSTTWKDSTQTGATTAKLTVKTTVNHDGYQYRCVVKDANGKKAYSTAATLTIK